MLQCHTGSNLKDKNKSPSKEVPVLEFLAEQDVPQTSQCVAVGIGLKMPKEVNPVLNKLQKQGKVMKMNDSPPLWMICPKYKQHCGGDWRGSQTADASSTKSEARATSTENSVESDKSQTGVLDLVRSLLDQSKPMSSDVAENAAEADPEKPPPDPASADHNSATELPDHTPDIPEQKAGGHAQRAVREEGTIGDGIVQGHQVTVEAVAWQAGFVASLPEQQPLSTDGISAMTSFPTMDCGYQTSWGVPASDSADVGNGQATGPTDGRGGAELCTIFGGDMDIDENSSDVMLEPKQLAAGDVIACEDEDVTMGENTGVAMGENADVSIIENMGPTRSECATVTMDENATVAVGENRELDRSVLEECSSLQVIRDSYAGDMQNDNTQLKPKMLDWIPDQSQEMQSTDDRYSEKVNKYKEMYERDPSSIDEVVELVLTESDVSMLSLNEIAKCFCFGDSVARIYHSLYRLRNKGIVRNVGGQSQKWVLISRDETTRAGGAGPHKRQGSDDNPSAYAPPVKKQEIDPSGRSHAGAGSFKPPPSPLDLLKRGGGGPGGDMYSKIEHIQSATPNIPPLMTVQQNAPAVGNKNQPVVPPPKCQWGRGESPSVKADQTSAQKSVPEGRVFAQASRKEDSVRFAKKSGPGFRSNLHNSLTAEERQKAEEAYRRQIAEARAATSGASFSVTNKGTSTKSQLYPNSRAGPPPPPMAIVRGENSNTTSPRPLLGNSDGSTYTKPRPLFNQPMSTSHSMARPLMSDSFSRSSQQGGHIRNSQLATEGHLAGRRTSPQTQENIDDFNQETRTGSKVLRRTNPGNRNSGIASGKSGFRANLHYSLSAEEKRRAEEEYREHIAQSRGTASTSSFSVTNKGTSTKSRLYSNSSTGPPPPPKAFVRGDSAERIGTTTNRFADSESSFMPQRDNCTVTTVNANVNNLQQPYNKMMEPRESFNRNVPPPLMGQGAFGNDRRFNQPGTLRRQGNTSETRFDSRGVSDNAPKPLMDQPVSRPFCQNIGGRHIQNTAADQGKGLGGGFRGPAVNNSRVSSGSKKSGFRANLHSSLTAEEKRKAEEEYKRQIAESRGSTSGATFSTTNKGTSTKSKLYTGSSVGPPPPPKAIVHGERDPTGRNAADYEQSNFSSNRPFEARNAPPAGQSFGFGRGGGVPEVGHSNRDIQHNAPAHGRSDVCTLSDVAPSQHQPWKEPQAPDIGRTPQRDPEMSWAGNDTHQRMSNAARPADAVLGQSKKSQVSMEESEWQVKRTEESRSQLEEKLKALEDWEHRRRHAQNPFQTLNEAGDFVSSPVVGEAPLPVMDSGPQISVGLKRPGSRSTFQSSLSAEQRRKAEEEYKRHIAEARRPMPGASFSTTNKGTSTKSMLYPNSSGGPPPPPKALVNARR